MHITGCQRSGTTLIFEMIAACYSFNGRCEHESSVFEPIDVPEDRGHSSNREGVYGQDSWLTKKPTDIPHIERIFRADSELYLIHMVRDPRAVVTSVHQAKPDVYFSSFERWARYASAVVPLVNHPRCIMLRYEDLVTHPGAIQEQLESKFSFLQRTAPFDSYEQHSKASEAAKISMNGLRAVDQEGLIKWHQHLPRVKFQLQSYPAMQSALQRLEYEADSRWQSMLDGVTPSSQSYGEDKPNFFKSQETRFRYWLKTLRYMRERSGGN